MKVPPMICDQNVCLTVGSGDISKKLNLSPSEALEKISPNPPRLTAPQMMTEKTAANMSKLWNTSVGDGTHGWSGGHGVASEEAIPGEYVVRVTCEGKTIEGRFTVVGAPVLEDLETRFDFAQIFVRITDHGRVARVRRDGGACFESHDGAMAPPW